MSATRQDSNRRGRQDADQQDQQTSTARLHPFVWIALIGLVIWFVLAIWGFGTEGYADWLLTVVSGFLLIAIAIPLILAGVARRNSVARAQGKSEAFGDWAKGEFEIWQDHLKGANAAAEIAIPIAAAAAGMTAFAIVFHYAAAHAV
jgi:uncharacterized ion transporter superfamily protein YfcC